VSGVARAHAGQTGRMNNPTGPTGEKRVSFVYQGWQFFCSAERTAPGVYKPVVFYRERPPGQEEAMLPPDTDTAAYGSEAEALRHAEQQAIRWVHDRTGDGRGQL
jgi:hypothetical protein